MTQNLCNNQTKVYYNSDNETLINLSLISDKNEQRIAVISDTNNDTYVSIEEINTLKLYSPLYKNVEQINRFTADWISQLPSNPSRAGRAAALATTIKKHISDLENYNTYDIEYLCILIEQINKLKVLNAEGSFCDSRIAALVDDSLNKAEEFLKANFGDSYKVVVVVLENEYDSSDKYSSHYIVSNKTYKGVLEKLEESNSSIIEYITLNAITYQYYDTFVADIEEKSEQDLWKQLKLPEIYNDVSTEGVKRIKNHTIVITAKPEDFEKLGLVKVW